MTIKNSKGYALILALIAVNITAIMVLMARSMWETELQRDLEEELLFRARQYKMAIELYRAKNPNMNPKDLEILFTDKFLRKLYPDPMTEDGEWNLVMQSTQAGNKDLIVVPLEFLPKYETRAQIVGVVTSSTEEGFREYRKKKRYCEWAVYVGEDLQKEMPTLRYLDDSGNIIQPEGGGKDGKGGDKSGPDGRDSRGTEGSEVAPPVSPNQKVSDTTGRE